MKKWAGYQSVLADSIVQFLQHKRALCKKYSSEESALRALDRYLLCVGLQTIKEIDSEVLDQFFRSVGSTHPNTYNYRLGVIRRLFEWMVTQDRLPASPLRAKKRRVNQTAAPFIFKHDDIKRLLAAASELRDTSNAHRRAATWQMMIMLGYGLGLRVGEICNLRVGDIDLKQNLLLIANAKFGKSRYVPMGPKLAEQLGKYVAGSKNKNETDPVFRWRDDRRALHPCNTWRVFRHLVLSLGLRARPGQREPRFHDLRHSFAVNSLLRFYQEGKDPSQHLLALSTFLGHSELQHTAVYLTITDELLKEANGRFQRFALPALHEVSP